MKKASVLIIILWLLFFLGILAVAVRGYVYSHWDISRKLKDRLQAYYLAKAGVQRVILEVLADETPEYDTLAESWCNNAEIFKNVGLDNIGIFSVDNNIGADTEAFIYGAADEERKININKVPVEVLTEFFQIIAGVESGDAQKIADSILDWRDQDDEPGENGAESSYYLSLKPPYLCKNEDFQAVKELLLVKGINAEIFSKVKDYITIYGSGAVNINTADETVLQSLGMDSSLAEKVIRFRAGADGIEGNEDDNAFENPGTISGTLSAAQGLSPEENTQLSNIIALNLLTVKGNCFSARVFGSVNVNRKDFRKIVFVFDRDGMVKYWDED